MYTAEQYKKSIKKNKPHIGEDLKDMSLRLSTAHTDTDTNICIHIQY